MFITGQYAHATTNSFFTELVKGQIKIDNLPSKYYDSPLARREATGYYIKVGSFRKKNSKAKFTFGTGSNDISHFKVLDRFVKTIYIKTEKTHVKNRLLMKSIGVGTQNRSLV